MRRERTRSVRLVRSVGRQGEVRRRRTGGRGGGEGGGGRNSQSITVSLLWSSSGEKYRRDRSGIRARGKREEAEAEEDEEQRDD
jgi:hypothetical protein